MDVVAVAVAVTVVAIFDDRLHDYSVAGCDFCYVLLLAVESVAAVVVAVAAFAVVMVAAAAALAVVVLHCCNHQRLVPFEVHLQRHLPCSMLHY